MIFGSGVPFVQLPCCGVVSSFTISKPELESYLVGKNKLADYLSTITIEYIEKYEKAEMWTKVIWDVTAVAFLLNDDNKFMRSRIIPAPMPSYDGKYTDIPDAHLMNYVYHIERDALMRDLIQKLTKK